MQSSFTVSCRPLFTGSKPIRNKPHIGIWIQPAKLNYERRETQRDWGPEMRDDCLGIAETKAILVQHMRSARTDGVYMQRASRATNPPGKMSLSNTATSARKAPQESKLAFCTNVFASLKYVGFSSASFWYVDRFFFDCQRDGERGKPYLARLSR